MLEYETRIFASLPDLCGFAVNPSHSDEAEAKAIAMSLEWPADLLITDESSGRKGTTRAPTCPMKRPRGMAGPHQAQPRETPQAPAFCERSASPRAGVGTPEFMSPTASTLSGIDQLRGSSSQPPISILGSMRGKSYSFCVKATISILHDPERPQPMTEIQS